MKQKTLNQRMYDATRPEKKAEVLAEHIADMDIKKINYFIELYERYQILLNPNDESTDDSEKTPPMKCTEIKKQLKKEEWKLPMYAYGIGSILIKGEYSTPRDDTRPENKASPKRNLSEISKLNKKLKNLDLEQQTNVINNFFCKYPKEKERYSSFYNDSINALKNAKGSVTQARLDLQASHKLLSNNYSRDHKMARIAATGTIKVPKEELPNTRKRYKVTKNKKKYKKRGRILDSSPEINPHGYSSPNNVF